MKFFNNSWDDKLNDYFQSENFISLIEKVNDEYSNHVCFPPREKVFSAFKLTPFEKVNVVVIGQDPYHEPGQAHGVSFSVLPGVTPPPSLKNIFKEINNDIGCTMSGSGCLIPWTKQGVFLLNSVLSVRSGAAGSHKDLGWQQFTDFVIKTLSNDKEHLVFLLWGAYAISKKNLIDTNKHAVLTAPHPSPFSAYSGFFGSKHFSKTNDILKKWGKTPIDWTI